jgi:hypothetical protein
MFFVETFEFETTIGRISETHEVRVTYTITKGRDQTYGQPAEKPEVGEIDFEINLSGTFHKASDDMHDFLLNVLGDDLDWLIEAAADQAA